MALITKFSSTVMQEKKSRKLPIFFLFWCRCLIKVFYTFSNWKNLLDSCIIIRCNYTVHISNNFVSKNRAWKNKSNNALKILASDVYKTLIVYCHRKEEKSVHLEKKCFNSTKWKTFSALYNSIKRGLASAQIKQQILFLCKSTIGFFCFRKHKLYKNLKLMNWLVF